MRFLMKKNDSNGHFLFELQNQEEENLLTGIDYETRETCTEAIREVIQNLSNENAFQVQNINNITTVNLTSKSGALLGVSSDFGSTTTAQDWIKKIVQSASEAVNYQVITSTTSKTNKSVANQLPSLKNIDFEAMYDFDYLHEGNLQNLSTYQHIGNSSHYFNVHNSEGKAILFSRGFDTAGRRNKRIRQVIDAATKDNRFETKEENGSFYFILKERNGLEIARSCQFLTKTESNQNILYIQNILLEYNEQYPKVEKTKRKMVNQYDTSLVGAGGNGFESMKIEDKGSYFIYNCGGKPVLFSQSYTSSAGRDNGIRSVIKNAGEASRYETRQDGGKFYFVLKSSNRQEIAQSAYFATEAEMESAKSCVMEATSYAGAWDVDLGVTTTETTETFAVEAPIEAVLEVAPVAAAVAVETTTDGDGDTGKIADDYLNCREYDNHGDVDVNGFTRWQHANGEFYFTWHNADGSVKMRSEGYPTTGARDNGMDSVMRNRDNSARYAITEKMGAFFVILKAGNHQEIARSCGSSDKAALLAMFPAMAAAEAVVKAEEAPAVEVPTEAIAMAAAVAVPTVVTVADKEDDYMICEEYKGHEGVDENGITRFKGDDGQFYFTIYDADGKVQLRSEGFRTEADLEVEYDMVVKYRNDSERYTTLEKNGYRMLVLKTPEGREIGRSCLEKVIVEAPIVEEAPAPIAEETVAAVAAVMAAAPVVAEAVVEAPAPIVVVEAPKVAIAAAVAAAAATVAHVIPEPKVEVEVPKPKIELKKEEVKVETPQPPVVPVVAAVAAAATVAAAVVNNVTKDKEDEYMVCEEYKGHSGKDANGITKFKGADGQFYFTIYDADGKVQLRSEGFRTEADLKVEYDMVVKYRNDKNRYTVVEKNGYTMRILKTPEGREIGRSCLEKIVVAAAVPPVVAPVAAEVAASGFKWWYLLPLLLLPLLWFLCNKPAAKLPVVTAPVVVAPTPAVVPAPAKPAAVESCDLNWIFFDFDKSDLRAASKTELDQLAVILKDHKDYVGLISAHTDSKGSDAYNVALSERRAKAARAYMATKGIEGSRIKSEMSGEKDSFTDNDEEDVKRQYNRRVELRVLDANGKEVCKSIAPDVK